MGRPELLWETEMEAVKSLTTQKLAESEKTCADKTGYVSENIESIFKIESFSTYVTMFCTIITFIFTTRSFFR